MSSEIFCKIEKDKGVAMKVIEDTDLPCTVKVTKGVKRSAEQNRLQWLWMKEASEQLGDQTAAEWQAYCKLHYGIPILREDDSEFRDAYDEIIKPLHYEQKLRAMEKFFPVTSLMTTKQLTRYLDEVYVHFTEQGVHLTEPTELSAW